MTERGSEQDNDRIVELSDDILKVIKKHPSGNSFQIVISALADAMIYICQNVEIERMVFKDICQQLVNQYDEIFVKDDVENF
jgi:hypothetical protein